MKHFNFKTLAMGAALAGSLFTTNAYAATDEYGLEEKTLCTLRWGNGRYLALQGFNDGAGMGTFSGPNGGNGRIYLERTLEGKYLIAGQGLFITDITADKQVTVGAKANAIAFDVEGNTSDGLYFSYNGIYLKKGKNNNDIQGTTTKPEAPWKFNQFGDNGFKAQLDGGQMINSGNNRYSVVMFPYQISAPTDKTLYKYSATESDGSIVFAAIAEGGVLPAGEPGIYKTTSNDSDFRLNIVFDNDDKTSIPEYVDQPKTMGGVFTGFYSKPGYNSNGEIFMLGYKDTTIGFYKDLTNGKNVGDGIYKQDQTNIAYLVANDNATSYTLKETDGRITLVAVTNPYIDEAIALVAQLSELKANEGTNPGQYNVTEEAIGGSDNLNIWNNLTDYDEKEDDEYANITIAEAQALVEQLATMIINVKLSKVPYELNLENVEIVTLQWGGTGRYVGLNGGGRTWAASYSMGTPNGGNARVGIVKRADGKYAVACQGLYLVADGDDVPSDARVTNPDDATGFNVTRSSENGLTFVTDDGWYMYFLNNSDVRMTKDASLITTDFKVNTFQYATYAKQDLTLVSDGLYMAAICLPFKVQKPTVEGVDNHIYTVTVENGQIATNEVNEVGAGVPFIYVSNVNSDDVARLIIPQENQEYEAPSTATAMKGWYQQYQYGTDDDPKNFYYTVRNGVFGFYTDAPADVNQAAISGEAVKELGAASFIWDAKNNKLVAVKNPTITINGWASLYLDYNVAIPDGVTAYYVSAVGDGYASLTQIEDAIPANTAVLLEAAEGSYTFEYTATATALEEGANMLKGTTVNTYIEGPAYVLANKNDIIGLYKAKLNKDENGNAAEGEKGTHFLNNANKAYLPVPAGSTAPMLRITRGEDTTGIENSEITIQNSTVIYDLLGRRVEKMEKGIYIVNGKKIIK